ncbi:MAG TPA: indole-3-glycerol-phosphate synthase [Gemmatimonadaceae bacterium]|nr:indole-3-glycerol-phosphate synthase [Gemmatimonadaceae bacterium]
MDRIPGHGLVPLRQALARDTVAVIAEIKRRSPSKGDLNTTLNAAAQAGAFERGSAAAISVLTEPEFFNGSLDDLKAVRSGVSLPILRKDFHVHFSQLMEARLAGASAVLLIARALSPRELPDLMRYARRHELETVVEVRDDVELQRAIDAGAEIIGVNSRNLETLEVDPRVPERIVPKIPRDVIAVWESGVSSVADVERAAEFGADAVLVGSALSRAPDPEALVRSLSQVKRRGRG